MVTALRVDGIDLSHHNAVGDPQKAIEAGVKFVYHKATEGATFVDPDYQARVRLWQKLGIPIGPYHFASPSGSDAIEEARFFVKHAGLKIGMLAPALDLESRGPLNDEELTVWAETFFKEVTRLTKFRRNVLYSNYNLKRKVADFLWVARYSNTNADPLIPTPWNRWDIRQFSDGTFGVPNSIPGLRHVDLNTLRPGLEVEDFTIIGPQPVVVTPVPEPEPEKEDPVVVTKPEPVRTSFIEASHNMFVGLTPKPGQRPTKWYEDLDKSGVADLVGYQETESKAQREALADWSTRNGRALYDPAKTGNAIGFDKDVFDYVWVDGQRVRGTLFPHAGAVAMGVSRHGNPGRDMVYVGLVHKGSGKKILKINVHPVAGGTKDESAPSNDDSDALSVWKDWAVAQYWLDIIAFTATEMSRQVEGSTVNFWDAISLGGDYNATLEQRDVWYYPANLLEGLYEPDEITRGLDHIQRSKGSDIVPRRRWRISGHTDHPIHFCEWLIKDVEDRPRDI